jgi:hypothetical protein
VKLVKIREKQLFIAMVLGKNNKRREKSMKILQERQESSIQSKTASFLPPPSLARQRGSIPDFLGPGT